MVVWYSNKASYTIIYTTVQNRKFYIYTEKFQQQNITLIRTVIKRQTAESLMFKIEMAQNPTSWIPLAKCQMSKKFSLKNLAVKFLLEKSIGKKSDGRNITYSHAAKSKRAEKNHTEEADCWNPDEQKNYKKIWSRKLVIQKHYRHKLLEIVTTKILIAKSCSEAIWFQKVQHQKASQ